MSRTAQRSFALHTWYYTMCMQSELEGEPLASRVNIGHESSANRVRISYARIWARADGFVLVQSGGQWQSLRLKLSEITGRSEP